MEGGEVKTTPGYFLVGLCYKADFWHNTSLPKVLLKNVKKIFFFGHRPSFFVNVIIYDKFSRRIGKTWPFFK